MKTIHVGGLNPFNRVKNLAEALQKANNDDTIVLHKNEIIASNIDKNIIIKGEGHTLTVESEHAGLTINKPVVIENVKFRVNTRANALVIKSKTILDDVTIELVGPIREFYPVVFLDSGSLEINGGRYTMLESNQDTRIKMNDAELYSYYGGDIHISTGANLSHIYGDVEISNSIVSNAAFYGNVTINDSTISKFTEIHGVADINHCELTAVASEPIVKLKKEPERGPLQKVTDNRYILRLNHADVRITDYTVGEMSKEYLGIYSDESVLSIFDTKTDIESVTHKVKKSTITFTDSTDKNYWDLQDTTPSFVRSQINMNMAIKTAMDKLNELVGLDNVKAKLKSIMNTIQINQKSENKNFEFAHHMIFAGEPGTGKTTVASITAEALFEIGAIPENKITKVTVDDLIKGYVGQTASNVRDILDKALGGVVFIDEAYELNVKEGQNSFNSEALSVIIRYMEDHRGDLVVIAAGYSKEMKEFLASNIGLARRFQWVEFEDYSPEEMAEIFEMIRKSYDDEYEDPNLAKVIPILFDKLTQLNLSIPDSNGRVTNGGNGGLVRNVYQRIIEVRNNRAVITGETQLTKDDIEQGFKLEMQNALNRRL